MRIVVYIYIYIYIIGPEIFQMINLFSDVIILIVVLLNFMYILTCLKLYYCNKLTEDLFCLAEQLNNCLSKKAVFISIYIYIHI